MLISLLSYNCVLEIPGKIQPRPIFLIGIANSHGSST